MEYIVFRNENSCLNGSDVKYPCNFCSSSPRLVVLIPRSGILICRDCLTNMIAAIDEIAISKKG